MVMLNKEYMINHMRNENGSINIKNVVLAAACEATELFQCLIVMDSNFTDWSVSLTVWRRTWRNKTMKKSMNSARPCMP